MTRSTLILLGLSLAGLGCGGAHGSATLSGCLNEGDSRAASRAPREEPAAETAAPWLAVRGNEIRVTRSFEHACCLSGDVETEPGPGTFEVRVRMSGEPCRCLCDSTVDAGSGAMSPGTYRVRLFVGDRLEAEDEITLP